MASKPTHESGLGRRGAAAVASASSSAESAAAAETGLNSELPLFIEHFVTAVRALPQTRQVLLEDTDEGPQLWTVIEAEPFERGQREPIYQAEGDALRRYPSVDAAFRLVNVSEFGVDRMEAMLPSGFQSLWRRGAM